MVETLLRTKLFVPPLRPNLVPRPRLISRLNQGLQPGHKLTLLSAPAGFGKTTLLTHWVNQGRMPTFWYALDENDNDLGRLLSYVVAALHSIQINVDKQILTLLHSHQTTIADALLVPIINQISEHEHPFVMILDDYYLIREQAIHDALAFLLEHLPPNMHLVIATRADPPLPLAGFAVSGIEWSWLAGLLLVAFLLAGAAWLLFLRRDIRVGGERSWRLPFVGARPAN